MNFKPEMHIKATVDLQGLILSEIFFHAKFKTTCLLNLNFLKKNILKIYNANKLSKKTLIFKNNLRPVIRQLECVNHRGEQHQFSQQSHPLSHVLLLLLIFP